MTVESQKVNPSNFSGLVAIQTPQGVIKIEIGSAIVYFGGELLERARIKDVQEAHTQLAIILKDLQRAKPQSPDTLLKWQVFRRNGLNQHGPQSVLALLPGEFSHRIITDVANTLRRNGIHTQEELASKTPAELAWLRRIGKKSQPLVAAMHQVAVANLNQHHIDGSA